MSKIRRIFKGGEDGFTLIELLVVIAVLGILAAIAIPRLGGVTDKARLSEGESYAGSLRSAQEMHYAEYGSYVTSGTAVNDLSTVGLGEYLESEAQENWTINFTSPSITDGYGMTITKDSEDGTTADKYKVIATPGGVSATIK
jgi:general secretion pathway protein G